MPTKVYRSPVVRLLWCLLGGACGLGLALAVAGPKHAHLLLASLGASAIFLFGLTRAAAAQPRALIGGHLGGAFIGIACHQALGDSLPVYALALVLTFAFMFVARTVHPPAGANPLIMIYAHADWSALWQPVLLGVSALFAVAVVWSRLYPGLASYPVSMMEPSPQHLTWGGWSDWDTPSTGK